jgi:hypothetical protein
MGKRLDLMYGNRKVATLTVGQDGALTLSHDLTADELKVLAVQKVVPVFESKHLSIRSTNGKLEFRDDTGKLELTANRDKSGFLDVRDPKGMAGLKTMHTGLGSVDYERVATGDLALVIGPFAEAQDYRQKLEQLYTDVKAWLHHTALRTRSTSHSITEVNYGTYDVTSLEISNSEDRPIATPQPIGAKVIGADRGRVDLVGAYDRQSILYLNRSNLIFRGISSDGWYWLENARLSRVTILNERLFKDLLKEVSDSH